MTMKTMKTKACLLCFHCVHPKEVPPEVCVCGVTFPSIPVAQVGGARLCPAPTSRQCLCPETH